MFKIFDKKTKIQKRVEALYEKMEFINKWQSSCKILYICEPISALFGVVYHHYLYSLNTIYAQRTIIITDKNKLRYCKERKLSEFMSGVLSYIDRILYSYSDIFSIKIDNDNKVEIEPCPILNLTSHEIDLAILEFENAIEKDFQKAIENYEKHHTCIKELSEG